MDLFHKIQEKLQLCSGVKTDDWAEMDHSMMKVYRKQNPRETPAAAMRKRKHSAEDKSSKEAWMCCSGITEHYRANISQVLNVNKT